MPSFPKNHPFIKAALEAEKMEKESGKVNDEVLKIRKWLQQKYPDLFKIYMQAKKEKQAKEKLKKLSEINEYKMKKKIRHYSILKSRFTKPGFGKGPRDG